MSLYSHHCLCFTRVCVCAEGDAYYLAIGGGVAQHNWSHIQSALQDQGFRCTLIDHTEDMGMISIQGPKRLAQVHTHINRLCSKSSQLLN